MPVKKVFKKRREKVASFPDLPTIQFLFNYSCKNKGRRFAPLTLVNDVDVYPGTQRGEGSPITFDVRILHPEQ